MLIIIGKQCEHDSAKTDQAVLDWLCTYVAYLIFWNYLTYLYANVSRLGSGLLDLQREARGRGHEGQGAGDPQEEEP